MSPTKTNQKKYLVAWVAMIAIVIATVFAGRVNNSNSVSASDVESSYDIDREYGEAYRDVVRTQDGIFYNGEYYECLGGLDSLLDGTYESNDIKLGLRALIGYESIGAGAGTFVKAKKQTKFGQLIEGTDFGRVPRLPRCRSDRP